MAEQADGRRGQAGALTAGILGAEPEIDPAAYTAPTSVVLGRVSLAAGASVWYHAVLRGDCESISLGAGSNIQDNCSVHADLGFPVVVGENVSVGHNAVLHGCTVEDGVLIGMGATVLNGARIGAGSLVAAQALVPQGMQVPPGSLVAGVPARVRRELTGEERALVRLNAEHYVALAGVHREAVGDGRD
jgi:carbonic anhydrase/acetyltransferase-like protein (isoleucine patch superfamily)